MDVLKMIDQRHSVRAYQNRPIDPALLPAIQQEIAQVNGRSGLHIQLIEGAEGVFTGMMARFAGWKAAPPAYLALVGRKSDTALEEKCGYYGEHLVLFLQSLGLNTCWVGLFNKGAVRAALEGDERVVITIAVGYGENQGSSRRSRPAEQVTDVKEMPAWFRAGVECALKAPTAINQQKFLITLEGDTPKVSVAGKGPFIRVDCGIVKYHFEAGSGKTLMP